MYSGIFRRDWYAEKAGKKPAKRLKTRAKDTLYFNELNSLKIKPKTRIVVVGKTGSGKSYLICILMNQPVFDDVIYFDPKADIHDNLVKQKIHHNWVFYCIDGLSPSQKREKFVKWKVLRLLPDSLYPGLENLWIKGDSKKAINLRSKINGFLKEKGKTVEDFKKFCCKDNKLDFLWAELKKFLGDNGMTAEEFQTGRKIIDMSNENEENLVVPTLIQNIFWARKEDGINLKRLLCVGIDEMERWLVSNSDKISKAFSDCVTQGRSRNILSLVVGTRSGRLPMDIKGNLNTFFIFALNENDLTTLKRDFGIHLYVEDFERIPKRIDRESGKEEWAYGYCFYYLDGYSEPNVLRFNQAYKEDFDSIEEVIDEFKENKARYATNFKVKGIKSEEL